MFPLWDEKPHKPYSDWCTGFPDVLFGWDLWKACLAHDRAYRKGYVKGYGWVDNRNEADWLLFHLTWNVSNVIIALIVYIGTRLFGWWAWNNHESNRDRFKLFFHYKQGLKN